MRPRLRWAATGLAAVLATGIGAVAAGPAAAASASVAGDERPSRTISPGVDRSLGWAPPRRAERTATFTDREVVQLTRDGTRRGASGLRLHHTTADRVRAHNTAVAYAACDGCRAVALSFQVVLADGGPSDVDALNLAVALNDGCRRCETLAVAYQVVVVSPGRTRLTTTGRLGLESVEGRLRRLARSDRPLPEIRSEADRLMRTVQYIVSEELDARSVIRERERWDRD